MIGQDSARFPVADPPSNGFVRGLPNTYEVNRFGGTYSSVPAAGWQRGELVRYFTPEVRLPTATPMYDSSDPTTQAGWARATS